MFDCLTDAHCHADFTKSSPDGGLDAGMDLCACACYPEDWKALRDFSAPKVKKSFGLHPTRADMNLLPTIDDYLEFASAVGETGLDERAADGIPLERQREVFDTQLRLADKFRLPAVIHCVGFWGELVKILKEWAARSPGAKFMLHAAKCSPEIARELEKIGGYFSFGLRELNSKKGAACAAAVSPDRILVETDALPSREIIFETIGKLADLRGTGDVELAQSAYVNYFRFYGK